MSQKIDYLRVNQKKCIPFFLAHSLSKSWKKQEFKANHLVPYNVFDVLIKIPHIIFLYLLAQKPMI